MKLKKKVKELTGDDATQATQIAALETAIGKSTSGSETGFYKEIKDIKGDIGASDTASGSLKKRCKDIETAIGDEDTANTILYRIKALETAAQSANSGTQ